jgi:hypothetical protein
MRQLGPCLLGWTLWHALRLDEFFEARVDDAKADVPWSRIAAVLAINRLCAPGSELAIEERWYPTTALDDLLHIPDGTINDSRLYRALDHLLPHKTALERHLATRYGELFAAQFDVLLYDLTSSYVEGRPEGPDAAAGVQPRSSAGVSAGGAGGHRQYRGISAQLRNLRREPGRCDDPRDGDADGGAQVRPGAPGVGL